MLHTINSRRSVRKWTSKQVSESDIIEIVEAGMNAPSAGNQQAWQFIVLTDKKIMEEYADFNKNVAYLKNAAAAIIVCGDLNAEKYKGLYIHDCSAATENILLAIHSKGMGGVWGFVFPEAVEKIKKLLNLPENIVPFSVVPFGYFDENSNYKTRFDKQKLHINSW